MRLPGEPKGSEKFVILQPFTPKDKINMVSFLVARSDPEGYGKLLDYRLPKGTPIDGPNQVFARINQHDFVGEVALYQQIMADASYRSALVPASDRSSTRSSITPTARSRSSRTQPDDAT